MAGMLKNMAPASAAPTAGQAPAGKITADSVIAQMHLNDKQKAQLQRIVLAGMKVMFDKQTHQMMLDQLEGPGTIAQKVGQGVAGLVALLMQESKNSLPPDMLIPAGMVLVVKAVEFLRESGQEVSDQDLGEAMNAMVTALLQAGGVDPDKLAAAGERGGQAKPAKEIAQ